MTVVAVLAIVLGLLYAYSDQGWKLFYQSYGRGLSQVKAKLAIKVLAEELREANKSRIAIGRGGSFGIPFPDDVSDSSPYIYFTKPIFHEGTGDVIAYNYVLYYFAKPKKEVEIIPTNKKRLQDLEQFLILKSIKFLTQSKYYTEDEEKTWPFLPPILEIQKSTLPEDKAFIEQVNIAAMTNSANQAGSSGSGAPNISGSIVNKNNNTRGKETFLDHFAELKKESRNLPISGNFTATSLTDPFTNEQVNIFFGQEYKSSNPIKIKVALEESAFLFGLMGAMSEFEVTITPRN